MDRVGVGQRYMVERLIIGMLCGGHVLLEGVPGLAKTLTVSTLARIIQATFKRLQFTPDLLPADLTGTLIYDQRTGDFIPKKGPIFANLILADEINRVLAKVQSALLEAMQERQVTIGDETYPVDHPFFVMATQNPIEQEGTYPLPAAQVDRFMLKVKVEYPSKAEERQILDRMVEDAPIPLEPIVGLEDVRRLREAVRRVYYGRQDKRHRRSRSRHTLSRGCGNPGYGRTCGIRFIAASNFVSGAPCEPGASTPDLWQRISTPLH